MLNRILKLTIVVVFALTGLILTEYLLPYISDFFGYDLYDNGFFGIGYDVNFRFVGNDGCFSDQITGNAQLFQDGFYIG